MPQLKYEERVMCDKGYWQEKKCWCPPCGPMKTMSVEDKIERRNITRTRQINERVIGRITTWGCFKRKWRSSWRLHKLCAQVAARLTQLELRVNKLT
jgi:hypothetical protein